MKVTVKIDSYDIEQVYRDDDNNIVVSIAVQCDCYSDEVLEITFSPEAFSEIWDKHKDRPPSVVIIPTNEDDERISKVLDKMLPTIMDAFLGDYYPYLGDYEEKEE